MTTLEIMKKARSVQKEFVLAKTEEKNEALKKMADSLLNNTSEILKQNEIDMELSKNTLSNVMLDRLFLDRERIESMAKGIEDVIKLPDPCNTILKTIDRPNGIKIKKVTVPLGVIGIIYESRPNVTSDCSALCLKSGNVCILRTGKEAFNSSNAITNALREGLKETNISQDVIQLIQDTNRNSAMEMMNGLDYIDLLIPRGGKGLIKACMENSKVPCIQTGSGICHVYIDVSANIENAIDIVENAKTQRPSVCNSEEVLLIHRGIKEEVLIKLMNKLIDERLKKSLQAVELRLDEEAYEICNNKSNDIQKKYLKKANEKDFDTEFLDYILAVKIVQNVEEACEHINNHSTNHSDSIITNNENNAKLFTDVIDSCAVYVNCSTRFTDGGEFGLGCEIGISTQKMHARGPMGLEELTSYKYVIIGQGNIK
ncbi:MAG: glutamate-5-semialdehyde dehydrogenase [Eubacteriales bacterium]|nr:glutamate-5-semialdehyde dehydrogenase [Eubacteriales bacterium]